MRRKDDEREFRLRPPKPPAARQSAPRALAPSFRLLMHHARISSRGQRQNGSRSAALGALHKQRCAVRVMYAKAATRGQWRAHGRYLARESATHEGDTKAAGFAAQGEGIHPEAKLQAWQSAGDQR